MVFALLIPTILVNNYVAPTVADVTGLQIILGRWSDMITNLGNFSSVESHFWPVQIFRLEKERFTFMRTFFACEHDCIFTETKSEIYSWEDLVSFFKYESGVTSEWQESEVFGRSCHLSGWTFSVDQPLFWALLLYFTL